MSARLTVTDPVLHRLAEEVGVEGPVAVEGSRTRWHIGGAADPQTRLVKAPTGIVEYVPDEMTVCVRAGTSVADLHAALAEQGQRTGLPERGGTVGGAIAVGENDVHVLGRGRVREAVLQIRYVADDAKLVTGGGPTVKNVTGFDLPRLMTGSLGTLGLFAEVILRTNPLPATTVWLESSDADPFAVLDTILRPSAVLWNGIITTVQIEGHGPAVAAETARLAAIGTWAEVAQAPELPAHRWSLVPSELGDPSRWNGATWVASIGVGTVWASIPQPATPTNPVVAALSRRVKQQFDPTGRLNPGRVPGAH